MPTIKERRTIAYAFSIAITVLITACSAGPAAPTDDPLADLILVARNDSASRQPPSQGSGDIRGTVMGYAEGPDTLAGAVRLSDVRVTAYRRIQSAGSDTNPGQQVATVSTAADGSFTLASLASGEYVVTFVPPAGSPYAAGWTVGVANPASADSPWWIMLPAR